jgi:hypothetical protein
MHPLLDLPPILALNPLDKELDFNGKFVTADLEALIDPKTGTNYVYMAAWYNGQQHAIFDISQFQYSTDSMLRYFWINLIENNKGKTCYFHNFGGYDSTLSLPHLLSINPNLNKRSTLPTSIRLCHI